MLTVISHYFYFFKMGEYNMRKKFFKILVFLFAIMLFFIIEPKDLYAKTKLNLSSAKISLSATSFQYTGYQIKPTVTIKFNNDLSATSSGSGSEQQTCPANFDTQNGCQSCTNGVITYAEEGTSCASGGTEAGRRSL